MKQSLLFSLCIVLLLSVAAASTAVLIGEGPVKLSPDEYVNITPVNSTEAYEVPQATVLGALDAASILGAFEYEVTADLPPEEGNLSITSIAGVENEVRNETPYAWTFWVNDEEATTGPAVTNVTDGDNVTYSYGPPGHSVENASYTLNVYVSVPGAEVNVTPTPTPTPTAEANVTITSPEEGANITAGNVTVSVNVTNFTLVEPTGQANAPGEGHLHYYLDAVVPTNASAPAIPETGGYVVSTNTSYTWENVTPGAHNLSVQLVNNDHTPIIPLAADMVNVTVSGVTPTPTPTVNVTPTPTVTVTPTPTVNVTPTPTVNVTPTPTVNVTPTPTVNVTPTPTVNVTPTPTVNVTPTPTVNVTPTPTVNVTPTPTVPAPAVNVTDEIIAGLSEEENLTTFVDAVNRSTVFQTLDANRTYIICAPTNEAFAGLGNETLSMILNDTALLDSILGYHIIESDYTLEELVMMCQNATNGQIALPTVEGPDVNVSLTEGGQVVINNAVVVTQIQITNNIIVYVIDGVLIPPGGPVPTPTPTPTPTVTVTPTPTVTVTPTPTVNVTPTPTVNVTPTSTPTPTAEANVTITSPEEGANITTGNVTVSVNVTNFTLVEPTGQANAPGEGHLHYYLDAVVPTNASAPAIPETGGYVVSTNTSHTWENVTPGAHNLSVQLVNNDHTPIIPLAADMVNVTVSGVTPTPTPTETVTPTPTVTVTPTPTETVTPTPTVTVTPTPTVTVTPAPTPPAAGMDLQLYDGWNFVSIPRPLSEGNNTAIAVFGDVDTGGRPIYTYAPATGFEPVGANTTLEVLDGYWVYSNGTATVRLTFSTDPVTAPASKTLSPGWNAIGYSDLTPSTANETLTSVEDSWVYVVGYDAQNQNYRPALINDQMGARGENQRLFPTEGYWLFMREDGTLAAISA